MKQSQVDFINNFDNFSGSAYLAEFYSTLNPENEFLLKFYDHFYKSLPNNLSMLELGGGPTIYQLISASEKVESIIFAEYAQSNLDEVNKFLLGSSGSWNWDEYISYVLKLNDKTVSEGEIKKIKERIRKKVKEVIFCDIRKTNPLSPKRYLPFDLLSMGSVADSVASSEEQLVRYLSNSFSLLDDGGYFIGFFAKNFTSWKHLDMTYKIYPVNEDYVKKLFPKLGLKITNITNSVSPDYEQEYEGIFAISAIKK